VVSVYLNAQQLSGSTQVSKLKVLGQLQDKLVNGSSRLGCKGHVIHKHRQYDSDISLDIDIDGCIRVRLGKAQGLEYRTHLLVPAVSTLFCAIDALLQQADSLPVQITLRDDSQCTLIIVYLSNY